jgi:hypothetical protein
MKAGARGRSVGQTVRGKSEKFESGLAPERPCVAAQVDGQPKLRRVEADIPKHSPVHRAKLMIGALGPAVLHEATPYVGNHCKHDTPLHRSLVPC